MSPLDWISVAAPMTVFGWTIREIAYRREARREARRVALRDLNAPHSDDPAHAGDLS